jgi:hypothetical protein
MSATVTRPTAVDLTAFTNQLGQAVFQKLGNDPDDMFYAVSTDYDTDRHPELKPWESHQVTLSAQGNAVFASPSSSQVIPGIPIPYEECFNNNTDLTQSSTFSWTHTTSTSFTWSLTETLSVGWKSSTTVDVPEVAKETVEWSVNFTASSTQSQTKTDTKTWNIVQPLEVPAYSAVKMSAVINQESYNVPFSVPINMQGCLAVMTRRELPEDLGIAGSWTIHIGKSEVALVGFIPMGSLCNYLADPTLPLTYVQEDTAAYMLPGVFTGSQGVNYKVDANQMKLGECSESGIPVTTLP